MASITVSSAGDDRFRVRWSEAGKRHQRTFTSAAEVQRFGIAQADPAGRSPMAPPIGEFVQRWAKDRPVREATAKRIESTRVRLLMPFFGDRPLDLIQPADVAAWVRWPHDEHQHSAATIRTHFCVLRAALDRAVGELLIPHNPCSRVPLPRVPRHQRAAALTRVPRSPRPLRVSAVTAAHHRACGPLSELRRALAGTDSAEEITTQLSQLGFDADADSD